MPIVSVFRMFDFVRWREKTVEEASDKAEMSIRKMRFRPRSRKGARPLNESPAATGGRVA